MSNYTEKGVSEIQTKTERDGKRTSRSTEPGIRDQRERIGIAIGMGSEG